MDRVIKHKGDKTFAVGYNGDDFIKNVATASIKGTSFVFVATVVNETAKDNEELKRVIAANLRDIITFIES